MKSSVNSSYRRDIACILARGASLRMGFPKGLACLPGDERPFVVRIVELYRELEIPLVVVALPEVVPDYESILAAYGHGQSGIDLVSAGPGGGTGRTLAIAWSAVKDRCTHLWAHPVDMPLVERETLSLLLARSRENLEMVIRPTYRHDPGHPVVLPGALLSALDGGLGGEINGESGELLAFEGNMKVLLSTASLAGNDFEMEEVECPDPGVVRDFDGPV